MKFIDQLKAYQHQKEQSTENKKVINKLKEDDQTELNQTDTVAFESDEKQLNLNTENDNDQTMLIDTNQIVVAENENKLNDNDITRPIDNFKDYEKINKLRKNVLNSKQKFVDSTEKFIEDAKK